MDSLKARVPVRVHTVTASAITTDSERVGIDVWVQGFIHVTHTSAP